MPLPANGSGDTARPQDVGIVAMEFYCPREYVEQSQLEVFDGHERPGKYTEGLGQTRMAICSDREDIHSISLTVVKRLLERNNLSPAEVGFLMVGTETLLDKSKSTKSVLMQLFEESGNLDIQGIDTTNACFGGTASLHHAVDWVTGAEWDGRFAIVVCGDIAVYAKGVARPTGGAGAIAMLVGPNAPLVMDRGVRTHFMKHAYDFYKPDPRSEYPTVEGALSVSCYMEAVFKAYEKFRTKFAAANHVEPQDVTVNDFDGLVFHAPYCKIVSKALARVLFNDFLNDPNPDYENVYKGLEMYRKPAAELAGKRILIFSYGSGLASSMFSIKISSNASAGSPLDLLQRSTQQHLQLLSQRLEVSPAEFDRRMKEREDSYGKAGFAPKEDVSILFPGTYYLNSVDEKFRRTYSRKPLSVESSSQKKAAATPVIGLQGLQINGQRH